MKTVLKLGEFLTWKAPDKFLVKVILLQLRERVHPQDGATPSFFMNQGALYWCFQLMYHLFKNSFGKVIKTLKIEQAGQYIWQTL